MFGSKARRIKDLELLVANRDAEIEVYMAHNKSTRDALRAKDGEDMVTLAARLVYETESGRTLLAGAAQLLDAAEKFFSTQHKIASDEATAKAAKLEAKKVTKKKKV